MLLLQLLSRGQSAAAAAMKHGIKLRKLGRTSSHRGLLLRNLVSALLHHETIKTTVPKAKEAQRMAEKIITLGKKGTDPARRQAEAYLLPSHHYSPTAPDQPTPYPLPQGHPATATAEADEQFIAPKSLLPKLFTTLSARYAERPGGYTRLQRYGNRQGDNAPLAILSLVDGPRDLKFEMAARTVGFETVKRGLQRGEGSVPSAGFVGLREYTQRSAEKVLKYRGEQGRKEFEDVAKRFANSLLMESDALNGLRRPSTEKTKEPFRAAKISGVPQIGRRLKAGERLPGTSSWKAGLTLARGVLGTERRIKRGDDSPRFLNQVQRLGPAFVQETSDVQ